MDRGRAADRIGTADSIRSAVGPAGDESGVGTAPTGTDELEAAIATVARFVSTFEPARFSGTDASVLVGWFSRCERLAVTGKTLAATRASLAHRPETTGHPTPAHWLSEMTGESLGESADVLRLGRAFTGHSGMEEACRNGRLSRQAARLVADALAVNPGSEDHLVEAAQTDTVRQLKDRCLRAKAEGRSAEDAARAHQALHDSRHCRTWTDRDGAFRLDARLAPDAGAALLASLTTQSERVFHRARKAGRTEPADAYRADALVALVTGRDVIGPRRRGSAAPTGTPGPDPDPAGPDHDAGHDAGDAPPEPTGPRAQVTLRVDLGALRRGAVGPGEVCEIPGVGPVPVGTARALMGDALTRLVITDGVDVTTVCHLGRAIPAHLRTALLERDRRCVVPGCDVEDGLEIDHVRPFAEGGPTSLDNLARLCRWHHQLKTHRGFALTGPPGDRRWQCPGPAGDPAGDPVDLPGPPGPTDTAEPPLFFLEE